MRIMLMVAYDGTNYHGWQIQPEATTIEGQLNKALSELTAEEISVIGASRTDAGVHSLGTVAVFDTNATIPPESYVKALNGKLPWDIRVIEACQVSEDFHPRHCDSKKTYCYHIYHGDILMPQDRLYNFHYYGKLDIEAMQNAAAYFVGEHDFAGFCAVGSQAETTIRTIYDCHIDIRKPVNGLLVGNNTLSSEEGFGPEYIEIRITGSGFLYNMVRIIAGTLLEVGRGHIKSEDMDQIIMSCNRAEAGPTLPPMGLFLEKYEFENM